jgi:hypothetical protein
MARIVLITSVVLLSSCALPKNTYYFESTKVLPKDNSISSNRAGGMSNLTKNDLSTASLELTIHQGKVAAIDTGIVLIDSLPPKKTVTKSYPDNIKPTKKQLYEEKKKAYREAKKAYAGTKNKRLDGFAVAGALLFTIAFFCIPNPPVAAVFAILGLIASVVGMKSRIWGLALASLIAASVILVLYIYMSLLIGEPSW